MPSVSSPIGAPTSPARRADGASLSRASLSWTVGELRQPGRPPARASVPLAPAAGGRAHEALVELLDPLHQLVDLLLRLLAQAVVVAAQALTVLGHLLEPRLEVLDLLIAGADHALQVLDLLVLLGQAELGLFFLLLVEPLELLELDDLGEIRRHREDLASSFLNHREHL